MQTDIDVSNYYPRRLTIQDTYDIVAGVINNMSVDLVGSSRLAPDHDDIMGLAIDVVHTAQAMGRDADLETLASPNSSESRRIAIVLNILGARAFAMFVTARN